MSDEAEDWRWVDVDGAQKPIDEWELVSSLSTGALPAYTLVWRTGWSQWLPACQVAELATAVPADQRETAVEPELDSTSTEPPPPPLDKYERYRTRQAASQLVGSHRSPGSVPPPPPGSGTPASRGATAAASLVGKAAAGPGAPPPPPPPVRRPMPTLIEQPATPSSMTLRPPGAVPPPPRGVPARPRISSIPEQPRRTGINTPIPEIAILEAQEEARRETEVEAAADTVVAPPVLSQAVTTRAPDVPDLARTQESAAPPEPAEKKPGALSDREAPTAPRASPGPIRPRGAEEALPSWSAELDAAYGPAASPAPPPQRPAPPPYAAAPLPGAAPTPAQRFPVALVALGALALALGVVVIVLLATRNNKLNPLRTAGSVAAPGVAASSAPQRSCELARPARRLAWSIVRSIPPYIASTPEGSRVAVGVAASRRSALGLLVDPDTLSAARAFAQRRRKPLLSVVPTAASGKLGFSVTRTNAPLTDARTVDGKPSFMLGMSNDGFARVVGSGEPHVIWPGGSGERMTEIRIATTPHGNHAVTFRRGGQSGQVLVGWLGPDGSRRSALAPVEGGHFLGTPMVAANDKSVLVAFAARDSRQDHWGVRLATAPDGKLPTQARDFVIPPGGPGIEAISPAAAGIDGGRWLLQWTEGSTGQHEVRVQVLGSGLAPIGDAITVSPKEANAGQGVVWVRGRKAISLFLVSTGKRLELWGAALTCP